MTVRADQSGGGATGGERYGWVGSQEVRSTYATENPDSLTLYALALSLTSFLWNTGKAVSPQTQYAWLQQNNQAVITNIGLPQP